jgi:hypothetical protein
MEVLIFGSAAGQAGPEHWQWLLTLEAMPGRHLVLSLLYILPAVHRACTPPAHLELSGMSLVLPALGLVSRPVCALALAAAILWHTSAGTALNTQHTH